MSDKRKRYILPEEEIPHYWYNIQADMVNKPMPPLHPGTKQPLKAEDLYPIFAKELCHQELNQTDAWIEIPEDVREMYKYYRSTPLVRAYGLEKALGTPAHIYFKNESVSPIGSHKLNSALAQAYYCKEEGVTNVTTETGAGQWGAALSYAAKVFGLEAAVYQVKISYEQKPYRRSIMQTFGAQVTPSPSMSTRAGKDILTAHPTYQGSLGTAISEAIELAQMTPNCKYTLGSVLSHVTLHQTIIGLEAEKQMEMAGEYPDVVIGCFGGGSNFGGISFPFMRHNILEGKKTRFVAAEPASCPKLTRGKFQYDFGDEAGYTPLLPMFTLGHNFAPAHIHAGGLRYHGAGVIVSQLLKDNLMEAVDIQQLESFEAGCLFAQAEGIIPAPESSHAIAAAIREAKACKETGEEKVILFNLSGHGLIDMASYDKYLAGDLVNYALTDEDIQKNLDDQKVVVVNTSLKEIKGAKVIYEVYSLEGKSLFKRTSKLNVLANGLTECFVQDKPISASGVYMERLILQDKRGKVISINDYWQDNGEGNFEGFNALEEASINCKLIQQKESQIQLELQNTGAMPALALKLNVREADTDKRILPAYASDGYFNLLPGEKRTVTVEYVSREKVAISAEGYNLKRSRLLTLK